VNHPKPGRKISKWKKKKKFTQTWHDSCCYKNHKVKKKTFKTVCIVPTLAIVSVSVASRMATLLTVPFQKERVAR
jgi:hypothetical protein